MANEKSIKIKQFNGTDYDTLYPVTTINNVTGLEDILDNTISRDDSVNLLAPKENTSNKVSAFQTTPDDSHYPTEKLVYDQLALKQNTIPANTYDAYGSAAAVQGTTSETVEGLEDRVDNLESIGRYLSLWNATSGLPTTNPSTIPYTYRAGDYYRVGTVAHYQHAINATYTAQDIDITITTNIPDTYTLSMLEQWLRANGYTDESSNYYPASGTFHDMPVTGVASWYASDQYWVKIQNQNAVISTSHTITDTITTVTGTLYQPSGSSYTGTASTTVYSGEIAVGDIFFYDGTTWTLQINHAVNGINDVKVDGTSVVTSGVANISLAGKADKPDLGTISLTTNWTGSTSPYTQTVTVTGATVTANSKVDIQPDATVIAQLIEDGTNALYIANNNGTLTCYAVGDHPTVALNNIQVLVTEVTT